MDYDYNLQQALQLLRQGRFADAERIYRKVLAVAPDSFDALHYLGIVRAQQGQLDEALALIGGALKIKPDAQAFANRGGVLGKLRRRDEALASYEQALALRPDLPEALYNRAATLAEMNRFEEALQGYNAFLAVAPGDYDAIYSRAATLQSLGRHEEALSALDAALAIAPRDPMLLSARGRALRSLGRFFDALASYDAALAADPHNVDAQFLKANVLTDLGRCPEAMASYNKVVAMAPEHAAAWNNRGKLRWAEKRDIDGAIADLEQAFAVDPDTPLLKGDLLFLRMCQGDWRNFEEQKAAINEGVRAGKLVTIPHYFNNISDSPADLRACAAIQCQSYPPPAPAVWTRPAHPRGKIRIGYLSGDFREHPVAYLAAGLYENHDRDKFHITAVDSGWNDNSPMRQRLEAAFDKVIEITLMPDRAAAEKIWAEKFDILVDLSGHTQLGRIGVLARRPAPVQAGFLGFTGTLGGSYTDYILADRIVIPEAERQFYSEKVVYLPHSYFVNDSRRAVIEQLPGRAECGLPEKAFVFCNFNYTQKITPITFSLWTRVMRQVEGSVLWLLDGGKKCAQNLRREMQARGVSGERLIFAPVLPQEAHLARLRQADLCLDTLPYNAHTTASDALWVGTPLATCRGHSFAGRVAASVLMAAGLPELVADSAEDYEALVLKLALQPDLLRSVRGKLRRQRLASPLFDTARFARDIEAAYRGMWERLQRGEPPQSFAVTPKEPASPTSFAPELIFGRAGSY